jgi:predicted acetyltransferase
MNTRDDTSVEVVSATEEPLLANLLELYIHDLSAVFPGLEVGPDGRFGYPPLQQYWSQPNRRFPFLLRCAGRVAGFALVQRGSPVADDPDALDMAEFFVLRQYRRRGVGARAATLVWDRLPGSWTIRVLENNTRALAFWREVVSDFVGAPASPVPVVTPSGAWLVFTFEAGHAGGPSAVETIDPR